MSTSTNRVTEYMYNADSRLERMIAWNAITGNQETVWEYGTTVAEDGMASNALVRAKVYPTDGGPACRVEFRYNRQAEVTKRIDPTGSVHQLGYDPLGRQVSDSVATLGSGVDGAIRGRRFAYNPGGFIETISSYSDAGLTEISSQLRFEYSDFGQVVREYQEHNGAVNVSTSVKVSYDYADGIDNTVRRISTTYPDARTIAWNYGEDGSIDDLMDRVFEMSDEEVPVIRYFRRGVDSTVKIEYIGPQVEMTYLRRSGMPLGDAGDNYTGLDRFGRIEDIRWRSLSEDSDLQRFQYGFDPGGRRTWRRYCGAPNTAEEDGGWDEAYRYDGLSQLRQLGRGDLNQNLTWIAAIPAFAEAIQYDPTGNWDKYQRAVNGTTTFDQTRSHNRRNEIAEIDGDALIGYDDSGNIRMMPKADDWNDTQDLEWDAWNNLTAVLDEGDQIARYWYDGLGRRFKKQVEEVHRIYYFSDQWQILEERFAGQDVAERQWLWGVRYVDDLVFRETFGEEDETLYALHDQWHCTGIVDAEGILRERYVYSAFGETTILAPDFSGRADSDYGWEIRFGAYRYDSESGLYQVRNRDLSSQLGRWLSLDPMQEMEGANLYAYIGNDSPNGADPLGLAKYGFNGSSCTLNVTMTWSLIFLKHPPGQCLWWKTPTREWSEREKARWKSSAEKAIEGYFNNLKKTCMPTTKGCCTCTSGVSIQFDLQFVNSGGDFVVTVHPVPIRSSVGSLSGRGSATFDVEDSKRKGKQIPIVHECGHMLGLPHPGQRLPAGQRPVPNSAADYDADRESLLGRGMQMRDIDFDEAFCNHITAGAKCKEWDPSK